MSRPASVAAALSIGLMAWLTSAAAAQSLADRVARAPDGAVRMSFAAREGVCGNGRSISLRSSRDVHWESACEEGPVRVALSVAAGRVHDLDAYVGGRWRPASDALDLGAVGAREAAEFFLSLVRTGESAVAKRAVLPAVLADSATVWPELLRVARDHSRPREARKAAVFWIGQAAAAEATEGLGELVADRDIETEVREHAIFALSQRPAHEAVPALIRVARGSDSARLRSRALFWLAGFDEDPRALDLFEEILSAR